jgi:hypothetical protein
VNIGASMKARYTEDERDARETNRTRRSYRLHVSHSHKRNERT